MQKAAPPAHYLDGAGGKSSKRLQSFLGLVAALLSPIVLGFVQMWTKVKFPVAEIVTAFLVYSAALQGVSYLQERKK
jgi:ABC-type uncharacterized transport system permease subunit